MSDIPYEIYTDGACIGNKAKRGIGGYAFIIIDYNNIKKTIYSGSIQNVTNNLMELIAVIAALKAMIRMCKNTFSETCIIYTDSTYIVNTFNKLYKNLNHKSYLTAIGAKRISNMAYWELLMTLISLFKEVEMKWVERKSSQYQKMVDREAKRAAMELKNTV